MTDQLKPPRRGRLDTVLPVAGLALGVALFFLSFRETHAHSFVLSADGAQISQTTQQTPFDYFAVPGGALALVLGLFGLVRGLPAKRFGAIGAGVGAVALGLFHVVHGLLP
jgi:hypothetical protein